MEDVDVVFHLAALKHVESCEYNPFEAMRTNIQGTQNVIDCALAAGVKNVIFSSTDKAVNPSNAMGTSKLMAEKLIVAADYYKGSAETVFSGVRFGNVLASSGSVLPIFISRIREGAAIEVTDFSMSRFIATFNQSIDLMFQALAEGRGGEIFIRKMPVINIRDLAEVLVGEFASLYGYKDVEITEIGPRAGEKLYEELLTEEEAARTIDWKDYLIVRPLIANGDGSRTGGKPFEAKTYTSRDAYKLSRKELRELMYSEQIFSNPHLMAGAAKHRRMDVEPENSSMKPVGVS
jgi:FlaA1/EpsC-like NDP-sugar epimerase